MFNSHRLLLVPLILAALLTCPSYATAQQSSSSSSKWKITSIRVCRDYSGNIIPHIDVLGSYPVYSFFIPRPVWTVNGIVVQAQPIYDRGILVAFKLFGAAPVLNSGGRNTVKLSLPDQTAAKIFRYLDTKPPNGDCYEFF